MAEPIPFFWGIATSYARRRCKPSSSRAILGYPRAGHPPTVDLFSVTRSRAGCRDVLKTRKALFTNAFRQQKSPRQSMGAARCERPASRKLSGCHRDPSKLRPVAAYFRLWESASQESGNTKWPTRSRDQPGSLRRSLGAVALKFVSRLIRPTIVTGMMAALIATASTPTAVPLGCGITWTRTGGVWIATPDCPDHSPPSQPPPNSPPPGPGTAPPAG